MQANSSTSDIGDLGQVTLPGPGGGTKIVVVRRGKRIVRLGTQWMGAALKLPRHRWPEIGLALEPAGPFLDFNNKTSVRYPNGSIGSGMTVAGDERTAAVALSMVGGRLLAKEEPKLVWGRVIDAVCDHLRHNTDLPETSRKNFPAATVRLYETAVLTCYGGCCPSLCGARLFPEGGGEAFRSEVGDRRAPIYQIDHREGNYNTDPTQGWIIHERCHGKLTAAIASRDYITALKILSPFDAFRSVIVSLLPGQMRF